MVEECFAAVSEYLFAGHVREVTFFDCLVHSVHKIKYYAEFADVFTQKAPILRKRGIRVGINHLTTLGFFYQGGEVVEKGLPLRVDEQGNSTPGSICRSHPQCREYIRQTYTLLAKAGPDFLYVDDDMNFNRNAFCYCPHCIARFEKETGLLARYGQTADFESLMQLIRTEQEVRNSYIDFNKMLAEEIYGLIEKTVHGVLPGLELGLMTYGGPFLKSEIEDWTAALKGQCPTLRTRPGGGMYTDGSIDELFRKLSSVAVQNEYLPSYVDKIQGELECFGPCQAKSLRFLTLECLSYLAVGCNGIAYSLVNISTPSEEYRKEFCNRWAVMERIDRFGEQMMQEIGDLPLTGIYGFAQAHGDGHYTAKWNQTAVCKPALHYAGLPITYRSDRAQVYFVNAETVRDLSDEEIPTVFEKPVFLTGEAAYLLNRRGFAAYTGCKELNCYLEDTKKRIDRDSLCGIGLSLMDGDLNSMQAFYHFPSYTMTLSNGGEVYATLVNFCGDELGVCTAATVNAFGQRVVIDGYSEFMGADPYAQKLLQRQLYRYLSDTVDYCLSPGKISLFERQQGSRVALTVLNPSYDGESDIEISIGRPATDFSDFVYYEDCETKQVAVSWDAAHRLLHIPGLPYMTLGYLTYRTE